MRSYHAMQKIQGIWCFFLNRKFPHTSYFSMQRQALERFGCNLEDFSTNTHKVPAQLQSMVFYCICMVHRSKKLLRPELEKLMA